MLIGVTGKGCQHRTAFNTEKLTLVVWSRLCAEGMLQSPSLCQRPHHAKGRPIGCGRQATGVAVREQLQLAARRAPATTDSLLNCSHPMLPKCLQIALRQAIWPWVPCKPGQNITS